MAVYVAMKKENQLFVNMCFAGQFQVEAGVFNCTTCQVGQYQDRYGQLECKLCAAGYFQNEEGQTACINSATIWAPILIIFLIFGLLGL